MRDDEPAVPAVAAPLLEMGFSLRSILNAVAITKSSGEVSAHTINVLASWMLEHPRPESPNIEDSYIGLPSQDNSFAAMLRTPPECVSIQGRTFLSEVNNNEIFRVTIWTWKVFVADCLFRDDMKNQTLV